jgi:hypothetical protein
MDATARRAEARMVPKKPRHHSWDESADEPAKLIEQETVEVEGEIPAEQNEPVEGGEGEERPPAAYEEE